VVRTLTMGVLSVLMFFTLLMPMTVQAYSNVIEPLFTREYQSISGFIKGGDSGVPYTDYPYAVKVSISTADLYYYDPNLGMWIRIGDYYVNVKIFVGGSLKWQGDLAAGGSSPTITANYEKVLVVIEVTFNNPDKRVYYTGTITWTYN